MFSQPRKSYESTLEEEKTKHKQINKNAGKRRHNSFAPSIFRARWAHLTGDLIIRSMDEAGSRESRMHGNSMAAQTTCPDLSCSRSCLLAAAAARNPQAICTTKNRERRATKIFTSHRRPDFTIAARRDDRRETRRGEESIADTWRARARKTREHRRVETRATTSESILTEAAAAPTLTRTTMRRRTIAPSAGRSGK